MSLFAVVVAAGSGQRFGGDKPKQYYEMNGRTVLDHSLATLLAVNALETVVVVLAAEDAYWAQSEFANHPKIKTATGGATRADSVLAGLMALSAQDDDWVLVHDAVRPKVTVVDIEKLIQEVGDHAVGGLLVAPVTDTIKQLSDSQVKTIDREQLWRALTPQLFRFGLLRSALQQNTAGITDEAHAIEAAGHQPLLVQGSADNIKITVRSDLN